MKKLIFSSLALCSILAFSGCSAEPGTKAWCDNMKQKDKGQWTAEETGTFTKHCLIGNYKQ